MDEDCADPAEDGAAAADSAIWQEEWVAHHYRLALVTVRAQFDNRNIELFERSLNGESVAALASAYGISEDAVYRARQRIRERLQELIAMQVRAEDGVDDEP
jgi:hypothetical protein